MSERKEYELLAMKIIWELWDCIHTAKAAMPPGASLDLMEEVDEQYAETAISCKFVGQTYET